ncbi:MAG: hypothetical protein RI553_12060 [Salibaculum sp.]|uniref:hypothetical protein n=1 Tax=Salibaculum sp. TaxID=2855480 RepID=UPI00286FB03F|nr:hypothetical protein [Salibaculum sp.]MDR9428827.1 hypothetical protein [Salibaculum sp.]
MTKDHETEPDDLVERLEDSKGWPNLGKAAAARIRALAAENKELALDVLAAQGQAADLEAENARLKNALIATRNDLHEINAGDLSTFEVQDAISAALEEKSDDE